MIYICDVEFLNNEEEYKRIYDSVPQFRKEKADKLRFQNDRNCSVGVWGLLQYALREQKIECDMGVSYGQKGKPYFTKHPDICFSLSHSGTKVMCGISDSIIGCDVQIIDRKNESNISIAKRFFTEKEYDYLVSLPEDEKSEAFFRIWTAKESYVKALGDGLSKELSDFEVTILKDGIKIDDEQYFAHEIDVCDEYKFAYCTENKAEEQVKILKRF